jgi:probable HAF family extracellular repeat protein
LICTDSFANAINNSGDVVGYYETSDQVTHAFLYSGGAAYSLANLIAPASGWTLEMASDINDAGEIAGSGLHSNESHAFLATPGDITIPPAPNLLNISTRLQVLNGDNVLIAGFIITGLEAKKVLLRGIGPSLANAGVPGYLSDPYLELHDLSGIVASNENWRDTQESEIEGTEIAPTDDKEAAIVTTLTPGAYTVILRQDNGGTGIGLVEAYDLDQAFGSALANISTRGFVDIDENVMIGGFISGNSLDGAGTILVRATGPSLSSSGVTNALQDPTLELHDSNGVLLEANDNWKDTQASEIMATGFAPTDDRESAVLTTLAGSAYTVIVRGTNNTTGVALAEVYNLE